jgi:transcriptional regulator with XRE-family HTH domain
MKKMNKARKVSNPLLQEVMGSITPLEMEKTRVKMELAARIADTLKAQGMSKSELAARVGKQPSEVTKWLSGTHNFTVDTLVEIAEALDIPVEQLFLSAAASEQDPLRFTIRIVAKSSGAAPSKTQNPGTRTLPGSQLFDFNLAHYA